MTLMDVQRDFRRWLTAADDASALRLSGGARAGLNVYQNNYRAQLVMCVEEAFPNVRRWTGDDIFHDAVLEHVTLHPPHAWTLDAYPGAFIETLAALFPRNPDLEELAWIEWSLSQTFVAADAEPVRAQALAAVDWDTAHLSLTPTLKTRMMTTNAESLWSALWEQHPVPESEMLRAPAGLLIWRRGFTARLKAVDALELQALWQLEAHGHFGTLCEWLVQRLGESKGVAAAGEMLANWLGGELITAIKTP